MLLRSTWHRGSLRKGPRILPAKRDRRNSVLLAGGTGAGLSSDEHVTGEL